MTCPSSSTTPCGGSWRINIYTYTAPATSTTTVITAALSISTSPASSYMYSGCVTDGAARALTGYGWSDGGMTVEKCLAGCMAKGFSLAGVE